MPLDRRLLLTSIWRRRFRLHYERWRLLHLTLASSALAGAFVHVLVVCGPSRMVAGVDSAPGGLGIARAQIHVERFSSA